MNCIIAGRMASAVTIHHGSGPTSLEPIGSRRMNKVVVCNSRLSSGECITNRWRGLTVATINRRRSSSLKCVIGRMNLSVPVVCGKRSTNL